MELADIVVTRGGANTIFELLAMAKLHVIVHLVVKLVVVTRLKMQLTLLRKAMQKSFKKAI